MSINAHVDRGATNIEQALSLSAAMLPEENAGRIVLISDGAATEGSLTRILDDLKSRDIAVDVLPVQYDYSHEVWLERLDLPRFVKIGDNYEGVIVLSSLQNGSGRLVVREQGRVISEQPVDFRAGKNRYVVPIKLREPGYYEYSATIETPTGADQLKQNNTVLNYLYVKGEGRVMVVRDSAGKAQDWQSLVAALKAEQRLVDVFTAEQFPRDALSLMPYDAVIFVNVGGRLVRPGAVQGGSRRGARSGRRLPDGRRPQQFRARRLQQDADRRRAPRHDGHHQEENAAQGRSGDRAAHVRVPGREHVCQARDEGGDSRAGLAGRGGRAGLHAVGIRPGSSS